MSNKPKTIEEFMNPENRPKVNWPAFVEGDAVLFFNEHGLEKMSMEDGNGNKAKMTRQKDDSIKIEYSSTTII